jgi:hypothetical protein
VVSRSLTSIGIIRCKRTVAAVLLIGLMGGLAGCGSPAATPGATPSGSPLSASPSSPPASPSPSTSSASPAPSRPVNSPSTQEPVNEQVVIDITISGGKVNPNGRKVAVPLGSTVAVNVTSDVDDEIHAHLGENDFTLDVRAGQTEKGRFVANAPGSFEIESHELGKIIVILNVN